MSRKGTCEVCGKQTSYKKYRRCLSCARAGSSNPKWGRFTSSDPNKGRKATRQRFALGACERCGKQATERHHKNGNTFDFTLDNIERLCRRCHMVADGRLAKLIERNKKTRKQQ